MTLDEFKSLQDFLGSEHGFEVHASIALAANEFELRIIKTIGHKREYFLISIPVENRRSRTIV